MIKIIPILDPYLQYEIFCDERISPEIQIATRRLPTYISIGLGMLNIFSFFEAITIILGIVVYPVLIYFMDIAWINLIYGLLIWLLGISTSGSNGKIWHILIFLLIGYLFIYQASLELQCLYCYFIGIWAVTFIEYKIKIQLIYKILKENMGLFIDCSEKQFIFIGLNEEDYKKYYQDRENRAGINELLNYVWN